MQSSNAPFISGLDLSESFYREAVEPIIREEFAEISYSAALIGSGSEVLGLDNIMSTDHHWGPRVMLFLKEEDVNRHSARLTQVLSERLPRRFRGYPTSYTPATGLGEAPGVQLLDYSEAGPINHRVSIESARDFIRQYLGFDIECDITAADWLTFPDQKLLSITSGRVFHDGVGLKELRSRFAYYPHDVWLYLLASQWTRIEQEEHLMGRAGSVGDEIGSAIIAARLVRDVMRLCFLMERQYAPYPKWFGSAFKRLEVAPYLEPRLKQVLSAKNWKEREEFLAQVYEYIAGQHNRLGITDTMPTKVSPFHDRPYKVISMGAFSSAIAAKFSNPAIKEISKNRLIGSIDQISDSTDLLADSTWREVLCRLYQ